MAYNRPNATNNIYPVMYGYMLQIDYPSGKSYRVIFSPENLEYVQSVSWRVSGPRNNVYVVSNQIPRFRLHRKLLGIAEDSILVDHINGDRFDNRVENLRTCTKSQNNMNRKITPSLLPKGIYLRDRSKTKPPRYSVRLKANYVIHYFGSYLTLREAILVYNLEVVKLHGEFAVLHEVPND